jgi:hypothetical protein
VVFIGITFVAIIVRISLGGQDILSETSDGRSNGTSRPKQVETIGGTNRRLERLGEEMGLQQIRPPSVPVEVHMERFIETDQEETDSHKFGLKPHLPV